MSCVLKEVTLATGASVPTTKADPVAPEVVAVVEESEPLLHPEIARAATTNPRQASLRGFQSRTREGMVSFAFCAVPWMSVANAMGFNKAGLSPE
jgi:hypothetical protein